MGCQGGVMKFTDVCLFAIFPAVDRQQITSVRNFCLNLQTWQIAEGQKEYITEHKKRHV